MKVVLLSRATGSISSSNLSAFVVTGSKAREIVADATGDARLVYIDTNGNEVSCPWQQRNLIKIKTSSPNFRRALFNW